MSCRRPAAPTSADCARECGAHQCSFEKCYWHRDLKPENVTPAHTAPEHVTVDREDDGRFIGEVPTVPGALVYGETEQEAVTAARCIALEAALAAMVEWRSRTGGYSTPEEQAALWRAKELLK